VWWGRIGPEARGGGRGYRYGNVYVWVGCGGSAGLVVGQLKGGRPKSRQGRVIPDGGI